VTNTGNLALTGGTFTVTGSTTFTGSGCPATLAVGASCTYSVVFRPTALTSYSGSVAFAYTSTIGAATGTGTPVSLSGSGVSAGPLAFTAVTFTCPTGTTCNTTGAGLATIAGVRTLNFPTDLPRSGLITAVVTITNSAPATATTAVTINGITVAGQGNGAGLFNQTGTTCGATLARGATCTLTITYTIPAAPPPPPARAVMGTAAVANNGSGTVNGSSNLALVGR